MRQPLVVVVALLCACAVTRARAVELRGHITVEVPSSKVRPHPGDELRNAEALALRLTAQRKAGCGDALPEDAVVARPDGGLRNVVVTLDAPAAKGEPSPRLQLEQSTCRIEPRVSVMRTGTELVTRSGDGAPHTARALSGYAEPLFELSLKGAGDFATTSLDDAGPVEVYGEGYGVAADHSSLRAEAVVLAVDTPYFMITGSDGAYALHNVPAGHHHLVVWHEALGKIELDVDLRDGIPMVLDLRYRGL